MSKILLPFLIIGLFVLAIVKLGPNRLFTPGAVQKVRHQQLDGLKNKVKQLEETYKQNLKDVDKVATAYEKLGKSYLDRKSWSPAIDALNKSISYGNNGVFVHHYLAVAYANRGKYLQKEGDIDKAVKQYKIAIEKNKKMYDSKYGLAIIYYYHKKKKKSAHKLLRNIILNEPGYYDAYVALGRFYYEEKRYKSALRIYNELFTTLSAKPDSPKVRAYKKICRKNIPQITSKLPRGRD